MNRSWTRTFLSISFIAIIALAILGGCAKGYEEDTDEAYHLVILGDPHLPGQNLVQKEQVIERINSWEDVGMVVAVGDICALYGTEEEYAAAGTFFSRLRKPLSPIAGNHDFIYETPSPSGGGYNTGSRASQLAKLNLFRQTFGLTSHYYSKTMGDYLLIFLSTDHETFSTGMSATQLSWLHAQLGANRDKPTIIFFHGPLFGTQDNFKRYINRPHAVAQPADALHALMTRNPQVFLWVSGHTHTPPTEESYASLINFYAGQVTTIHNKDMKGETIWTNSLFLYPDRIEVKTFNHREGKWLPELNRTIVPPVL